MNTTIIYKHNEIQIKIPTTQADSKVYMEKPTSKNKQKNFEKDNERGCRIKVLTLSDTKIF